MKHFRLTLAGQSYQVTIDDPNANPVQVTVDGQVFQVQIEALESAADAPRVSGEQPASAASRAIKAPMPGVINRISVSPGERVEHGQEVCILEAMKMNNVIRAPAAGQIVEVRVALKQSVQHGDVLMVLGTAGVE